MQISHITFCWCMVWLERNSKLTKYFNAKMRPQNRFWQTIRNKLRNVNHEMKSYWQLNWCWCVFDATVWQCENARIHNGTADRLDSFVFEFQQISVLKWMSLDWTWAGPSQIGPCYCIKSSVWLSVMGNVNITCTITENMAAIYSVGALWEECVQHTITLENNTFRKKERLSA